MRPGLDSLRTTKADVMRYLKDSFAYLHKAVVAIDDMNIVIESPPDTHAKGQRDSPRTLGGSVDAYLRLLNGGISADERDSAARQPFVSGTANFVIRAGQRERPTDGNCYSGAP
jgi:hypothetical protein